MQCTMSTVFGTIIKKPKYLSRLHTDPRYASHGYKHLIIPSLSIRC
jgi:hypothetical protein